LGYRIFLNPEILDLPALKQLKETPIKKITTEEKDILISFMKDKKPYLNPELKIGDLALQMDMPKHELSRIINHGFGKNFFDFVNEYRVDTFIALKLNEKREQSNFLELAYQAGFNSKSAFNRAFHKATGLSPSQYFKKNSKFRPTLQNGAKLAS
jgi:AraC-like DNA-binding protein